MNSHLIDKLSIEIHLPDAGKAYEFQHNVSSLIHNELMAVIAGHCDTICPDKTHFTLEKLELDLGKLPADNFEQAFAEQFTRQFTQQLTKQAEQEFITANGQTASSLVQAKLQDIASNHAYAPPGQTPARFEALKLQEHEHAWLLLTHFLSHGTLPWYVDSKQFSGITATVELLISSDKLDITALILLLKNETLVERLIAQLDDKTLTKLYACASGIKIDWPALFHELQQCLNLAATASHSSTDQQTSPQKPPKVQTASTTLSAQQQLRLAWKLIWKQVSDNKDQLEIFSILFKQISAGIAPDIIQRFKRHLIQNSRIKAITGGAHQDFFSILGSIVPPQEENTPSASSNLMNSHLPSQDNIAESSSKINSPDRAGHIDDVYHQQISRPTEEKTEKLSPTPQANNFPPKTAGSADKQENHTGTHINKQQENTQSSHQAEDKQPENELNDLRQQALQSDNITGHTAEGKTTKLSDNKQSLPKRQQTETRGNREALKSKPASASSSPLNSPQANENVSAQLFSEDNYPPHSQAGSNNQTQDGEQTSVTEHNQTRSDINNSHNQTQNEKPYISQSKSLSKADKHPQASHQQEISSPPKTKETDNKPTGKAILRLNRDKSPDSKATDKPVQKSKPPCFVPEVASQGIAVENAGLVIFWPYLHIYFKDLGLFDGKDFNDLASREKAVHLLQYLATGEINTEEHALTLNKLLCHWDFNQPLKRFVSLSKRERKESEKLINAVINHWNVLGKTSIGSFRNTFIQRKGLLSHQDSGWLLRVEKGPYDILLERIPWGLSMIKLSWVDELLQVEW